MQEKQMNGPSYPAARTVAQRLETMCSKAVPFAGCGDVPGTNAATIEELITTAFWASLRREEGRAPRISIAFMPPEQSVSPVRFNPRVRLRADLLGRLAPAVESPGIHIGVWPYD